MLAARLDSQPDYESRLNAARVFLKEWHFRVGVHHLRGLTDAFEAGKSYADLAEAVIAAHRSHGGPAVPVVPISSGDFPTRARRPP